MEFNLNLLIILYEILGNIQKSKNIKSEFLKLREELENKEKFLLYRKCLRNYFKDLFENNK